MKFMDIVTSRLLLIFPEILNFQKIFNPDDELKIKKYNPRMMSINYVEMNETGWVRPVQP